MGDTGLQAAAPSIFDRYIGRKQLKLVMFFYTRICKRKRTSALEDSSPMARRVILRIVFMASLGRCGGDSESDAQ